MTESRHQAHWDGVYSARPAGELSWHQDDPTLSLALIREFAPGVGGRIVDVGGGASVLVDRLLDLPFEAVAVLDISEAALNRSKARLGARADRVEWIAADLLEVREIGAADLWHDRAFFHFLIDPDDRARYRDLAARTVRPGGHLIVAAFADAGPPRCSGLDVRRYNARSLADEFCESFTLIRDAAETHRTPWHAPQAFVYGVFRRSSPRPPEPSR